MSLAPYRRKRDFSRTPEPRGAGGTAKAGAKAAADDAAFVIQKHAARRLHYDLRLELDGVLKSWAVTRGPSLDPADKRLAVEVEDHPLDYGAFEGTIPKGEYGGGTVIVWDRGTWRPLGDPHKGLAKGHLEFALHGEKLQGRWHLVRMAPRAREKRVNWLLIKGDDEAARPGEAAAVVEAQPLSVKTGRAIEEVAGEAPGWSSQAGGPLPGAKAAEAPRQGRSKNKAQAKAEVKSQAKTRAKTPAKAPATSGELPRKAAQARRASSAAKKSTASRPPAADGDPQDLPGARKAALPDFVPPMLASLAAAAPKGAGYVHEIKFDGYRILARIADGTVRLLTRGGLDWTGKFGTALPAALAGLPAHAALIDGEVVVETASGASDFSALQQDLSEGRADRFVFYAFDLLHLDGADLRAVPLVARKARLQRLLAGAPAPLRFSAPFSDDGALVLAHACRLSLEGIVSKRADGRYRSGRSRDWIKAKCSACQEFVVAGFTPSSVSDDAIGALVLGVYEEGRLVPAGRVGTGFSAAVARDLFKTLSALATPKSPFAAPLPADAARHARFVRPDKVAEVEFRGFTADGRLRHASFRGLREDKPAKDVVREMPTQKSDKPPRRTVPLTHPDRLYWPEAGITKEGLADYWIEAFRLAAPHMVGRPLALLRCPEGIEGERFFQKHLWQGANRHIVAVHDPKDKAGAALVSIDSLDGLLGLVQAAALEIHPWGSTLADWEAPDRIVMDLDPDASVPWETTIAAAREIAQRLKDAGLVPFVKTTGGKGLHVVAPLVPKARWPEVKAFAKAMADAMAADSPDLFVATIAKAKRRGRILIDYLRNQRGATAVAPYSPRARAGAPVSMPLAWDELGPEIGPAYFTVGNTPVRLAALAADPWAAFAAAAAPLPAGATRAKRRAGV
ncbi:DNA ligase D [Xanthobacter sp. KR7-225]|uniref:DNA ligase D n=1 Tax=Xanthobacter sp. KR7-225 TaxID=3156613 RepID=UPI0032B5387B